MQLTVMLDNVASCALAVHNATPQYELVPLCVKNPSLASMTALTQLPLNQQCVMRANLAGLLTTVTFSRIWCTSPRSTCLYWLEEVASVVTHASHGSLCHNHWPALISNPLSVLCCAVLALLVPSRTAASGLPAEIRPTIYWQPTRQHKFSIQAVQVS